VTWRRYAGRTRADGSILDREDAPQNYRGDGVNALDYLARAHLLAGELTTAALMLEATVQEATGGPGAS
jgi:hypothetical protein